MQYWCGSDIGKKRSENQDSVFAGKASDSDAILLGVFDGMGGINGGKEASTLCVDIFSREVFKNLTADFSCEKISAILQNALTAANESILKEASDHPGLQGMGTTLTAALIKGQVAVIVNVGDSRTYLVPSDGGTIRQITRDHSLAEELFLRGELNEEEYRNFPQKNIITRAVGTDLSVEGDIFVLELHSGESLLLCSDGLTNMLTDEEITAVLREKDTPDIAGQKLIDFANQKGGKDNISVVLARFVPPEN